VTDQLNGLRFDIYERVHLPAEVAAIEELEEIELVPHMQALPQSDRVLLRGHLLLSGVYRSDDPSGSGSSQLEHWIPMEIALPLNRIRSMEELAVEIDNFDVDLLDARSLNVTGVLALRGLEIQSAQSPIWNEDSFTVVHQAAQGEEAPEEEYRGQPEERDDAGWNALAEAPSESEPSASFEGWPGQGAAFAQDERDEWGQQQQADDAQAYEASKESKESSSWLSMFQHLEEAKPDAANERPSEGSESASLWGDLSKTRQEVAEAQLTDDEFDSQQVAFLGAYEEQAEPEQAAQAVEDRPDVKVALGGKPLDAYAAAPQQFGVGLLSQLGEKGAKREAELRVLEAAEAEEKALLASQAASGGASSGDELEWTRLFLNGGSESQAFRKVRMCIVQREETLESIAGRYSLQPRELQLYNRLQEPYLSEGQVLYIP